VDGKKRLVPYKEWADLIQASFEKCYYVPSDPTQDKDFNVNTALVNRRGIYKDVYGTPKEREWSDYQVRPHETASQGLYLSRLAAVQFHTPHDCRARAIHAFESDRRSTAGGCHIARSIGHEDSRPE
jgi:hypothetical protein